MQQTVRRSMLKRLSQLSPSHLRHHLHFTFAYIHTQISTTPKNPIIFNYLINTLNFPKSKALTISNSFSHIKTLEKPQEVVQYLRSIGFSDTQIQSSANARPQILFSDVEKTLKPKLQLFQDLDLSGSNLGKFISERSPILTYSLSKTLKPSIDIIKNILGVGNNNNNCGNNEDLIRVLSKCYWIACRDPETRLLANVLFLKSCGIVGSQLAMLLKRQPKIFVMPESKIKNLVSKAVDMGFSVDSRMFVHGVHSFSCISSETYVKKLELFKSFGFTETEYMQMFKMAPLLLRTSQQKLQFGLKFYMEVIGLKRSEIVGWPTCLMYGMENRVLPRYRVLELMKSKGILKEPRFLTMFYLTEEKFLEKSISRFPNHAEELMVAYKSHLLESLKD